MTASQVTALAAQSSLCGQTGTGSSKLSLPETVCLACAQSCLSPLQLLHWMFQGKISASKTVFCVLYLWKTFNSSPEDMRLLSWHPDVAWVEPDLGKCWAKFPAPGGGGDTGWCLLSLPRSELENILMSRKCTGATDHTPTWAETELWRSPGKFPCFKSVTQGPRLSITLICPRGKEKQTELNV